MGETETRLRGTVSRVKLRRLKGGGFRHWTRVDFEPGHAFRDVRLEGRLPEDEPLDVLLAAIRERYDVPGLPNVEIPDAS